MPAETDPRRNRRCHQRRLVQSKTPLPRRIGIEKLSCRAQRGDHLGGVLKKVAVPLLRLALRLLAVLDCALIHGHGHQAGELAQRIAQSRDVQRHRNLHAVFAAHLGVEARNGARRQHTHALDIRRHQPRPVGLRRPLDAAQLLHLRYQPLRFAGRKKLHGAPPFQQLRGTVAQHALGRGIAVDQPAAKVDRDHCRTGRIQKFPQSFGDGLHILSGPDAEQAPIQQHRKHRRGHDGSDNRQRFPPEIRKDAGESSASRNCQDGKRQNEPELGDPAMLRRRGLRLLGQYLRPLAHRLLVQSPARNCVTSALAPVLQPPSIWPGDADQSASCVTGNMPMRHALQPHFRRLLRTVARLAGSIFV